MERIARLAKGRNGLRAWYVHGLDVTEAVPLLALQAAAVAGEPKISNFLVHCWERLRTLFLDRREHFEALLQQEDHERHALRPLLLPPPAV